MYIVVVSGSADIIELIIFIKVPLLKETHALGRNTRLHLVASLIGHGLHITANLRCHLCREPKRATFLGTSAGNDGLIDTNIIVTNAFSVGVPFK